MSSRNLPAVKVRPAHKAKKLTADCRKYGSFDMPQPFRSPDLLQKFTFLLFPVTFPFYVKFVVKIYLGILAHFLYFEKIKLRT
jgi:hypothetical protein